MCECDGVCYACYGSGKQEMWVWRWSWRLFSQVHVRQVTSCYACCGSGRAGYDGPTIGNPEWCDA